MRLTREVEEVEDAEDARRQDHGVSIEGPLLLLITTSYRIITHQLTSYFRHWFAEHQGAAYGMLSGRQTETCGTLMLHLGAVDQQFDLCAASPELLLIKCLP